LASYDYESVMEADVVEMSQLIENLDGSGEPYVYQCCANRRVGAQRIAQTSSSPLDDKRDSATRKRAALCGAEEDSRSAAKGENAIILVGLKHEL